MNEKDQLRFMEFHRRIPLWRGESLDGKSIVVCLPDNIGDTLHYCRFVDEIHEDNCRITLMGPTRFEALLRSLTIPHKFVSNEDLKPRYDYRVLLVSLPFILEFPDGIMPTKKPYLAAEPQRLIHWRKQLSQHSGPLVAINWCGRPDGDLRRDIPLTAFEPLMDIPNLLLVSVQQGSAKAEIAKVSWKNRILDLGDTIDKDGCFLDAAAIFDLVDLTISSDTGSAHLAGALGVRIWLGLITQADWRWGDIPERSVLYPTMRLYRQKVRDDWSDVIEAMCKDMCDVLPISHQPSQDSHTVSGSYMATNSEFEK